MIKFDIGWAFNSIFYAESGFGIQILKFSIFFSDFGEKQDL